MPTSHRSGARSMWSGSVVVEGTAVGPGGRRWTGRRECRARRRRTTRAGRASAYVARLCPGPWSVKTPVDTSPGVSRSGCRASVKEMVPHGYEPYVRLRDRHCVADHRLAAGDLARGCQVVSGSRPSPRGSQSDATVLADERGTVGDQIGGDRRSQVRQRSNGELPDVPGAWGVPDR